MKVAELFEDVKKSPDKGDFYDTIDRIEKVKNRIGAKRISSEARYGRVYDQPKRVNSVLKVARHPNGNAADDGYFSYIKRVMNLKNPYFPQVDELKQADVPEGGEPYYTVRMEKLHPVTDLSDEEIHAIYNRMFGRELSEKDIHEIFNATVKRNQLERNDTWQISLATFLERCVEHDEWSSHIQDPELQQALKMLKIFWKNHHYLDIDNYDNIMVRRTPYGAQVVFTDPFSIIKSPEQLKKELEANRAAQVSRSNRKVVTA